MSKRGRPRKIETMNEESIETAAVPSVTDRLAALEFEVDQVSKIARQLWADRQQAPAAVSSVGSVGVQLPDAASDASADDFLLRAAPEILQKLANNDEATAVAFSDWLLDDSKVLQFFVIWFASNEEIRKFILFITVLRNLNVSPGRFELLRMTISPAGFEEVKQAYQNAVTKAQELAKPAEEEIVTAA